MQLQYEEVVSEVLSLEVKEFKLMSSVNLYFKIYT